MEKRDPGKYCLIACTALSLALSVLLWRLGMRPVYAYLVGISVVTFFVYGYDKRHAVTGRQRIPENLLHLLALGGGTIGALLGQVVWRHKTKKLKFQVAFIIIVLAQIALAALYWQYYISTK